VAIEYNYVRVKIKNQKSKIKDKNHDLEGDISSLNTIKERQQDHLCQEGRSVLNVMLRVTEVGAALYL
jgi:hypothetical protein